MLQAPQVKNDAETYRAKLCTGNALLFKTGEMGSISDRKTKKVIIHKWTIFWVLFT